MRRMLDPVGDRSISLELRTAGPVKADPTLVADAVVTAGGAASDAKLAIVYLPLNAPNQRILAAIKKEIGAVPLVGATTGGAAFTEHGTTRDGAVVGVLFGDGFEVTTSVARDLDTNTDRVIHDVITALPKPSGRKTYLMTLCDAFATDGATLVEALKKATPLHWQHFGGTAGDNWQFTGTKVFHNQEVISGGAVVTAINSNTTFSLGVRHGWCAADGAKELVVTKTDANKLVELDHRPALEVYTEELVRLGLLEHGSDPVPVMATFELGANTPFGDELQIRAPLGAEGTAVVLASSIPERSIVRVVKTDPKSLIDAARQLEQDVSSKLSPVRGKLVFDCAARLQLLAEHYDEQVDAYRGKTKHPILGMACYGEIARFRGSVEGFHNTTAVIAAW